MLTKRRTRYAARRKALRRFKLRGAPARRKRVGGTLAPRSFKRRRYGRVPRINAGLVGSISSLVPRTKYVMHTYQHGGIFQKYGASGVLVAGRIYATNPQVILANSVYDPNAALTGLFNSSASLYNYMARLYNMYEVVWSKIYVTFRQASAADITHDIGCGVRLDDNGGFITTTTGWASMRNDPRNRTGILKTDANKGGILTLKHMFSRKKLLSSEQTFNASNTGSNPSTSYMFIPFIGNTTESDTASSPHIIVSVRLYMMVKWSDPKDIAGDSNVNMAQVVV